MLLNVNKNIMVMVPHEYDIIIQQIEQESSEDSDMDIMKHIPNDKYCACPQCVKMQHEFEDSDADEDVDVTMRYDNEEDAVAAGYAIAYDID